MRIRATRDSSRSEIAVPAGKAFLAPFVDGPGVAFVLMAPRAPMAVSSFTHVSVLAVFVTALASHAWLGSVVSASPGATMRWAPDALADRTHRYVVNARVRPLLLFWIGRHNIGSARFTWRLQQPGTRGLEVLIGSDPERAPRRINRWGYIAEETKGGTTVVLGLMTDSSERSLDEAEQKVSREREKGRAFKALQMTVAAGRTTSTSSVVHVADDWTYRDLDRVMARLDAAPRTTRTAPVPASAEPGFLSAVTGLLDRSLPVCPAAGGRRSVPPSVDYIYNVTLYRLSFESCEPERVTLAGGETIPAVDAKLAIQNLATKNVTRFRVVYGVEAAWASVPTRVVFRPQWWIEVELSLDDEVTW